MQIIIHPDYVREKAERRIYTELLGHFSELRAEGKTWIALPSEAAAWWRLRSKLKLVNQGGVWHIEGEGRQRARVGYATLVDEGIKYECEAVT
jgi:hypothetical protein